MPSLLYPDVSEQHVDLATRKAAMAAQLGQALTPAQLTRLANRQSIDEENARVARGNSPLYPEIATGPRGIDVNSYTGSMWNGTARPLAPANDSARNPTAPLAAPKPAVQAGQLSTLLSGTGLDPQVRNNRMEADTVRNALAQHELAYAPRRAEASLANTTATTEHTRASTAALQAKEPKVAPQIVDVGGGRQALVGAAQLVPQEKEPKPETFTAGGKTFTIGPGNRYFDDKGNPVDFSPADDKPVSINTWLMAGRAPEEYLPYVQNFSKLKSATATPAGPAAAAAPAGAPKAISSQAEFDALPPGTRFSFGGRTGVKKDPAAK